jgi:hypothetical protein
MMVVNDNDRVVNKLETSLSDDAKVVIYDRHMFIVQATDYFTDSVTVFDVYAQHFTNVNTGLLG